MFNPHVKKKNERDSMLVGLLPKDAEVDHYRAKALTHLILCAGDSLRQGIDPNQTVEHEVKIALNYEIRRLKLSITLQEYSHAFKYTLERFTHKRFTEDPDKRYTPFYHMEYQLYKARR